MKLATVEIKNKYELTYLLPGDLLDAEIAKIKKEITDLVKKNKGKILEESDWGRKHLSYKLRHEGKAYDEASYICLEIELPTQSVQKFDRALNLENQLMRHLLVLAEEKQAVAPVATAK